MFIYVGSSDPIKNVAAEFKTEPGWKLKSEHIEPPRIACLGGNACPSLHRVWVTDRNLTKEEFQKIIKESGWDLLIEGDCIASGSVATICSATGKIDKFNVDVSVEAAESTLEEGRVILLIREADDKGY